MPRTIPIIKLYRTLIVSIQTELRDDLVLELKDDIASEIRHQDVDGLILEVSGIDIIDSYIARSICDIAKIARLMGVRTVLAGLDPGMATTLVEIGMVMRDVSTSLNLESAVESFARKRDSEPAREDSEPSPEEDDDLLPWSLDDATDRL